MPGILPMKMIKVGASTQSRIAQACDRCRSKKIRCDGVRPCCTQCANVGFECKTSDKLSRRAFPRGYTESLEDRVRALEAEVRDLKILLDEKDEKIDMLSKIHSFSLQSRKKSPSPKAETSPIAEESPSPGDTILVEIPAAVNPASSSNGTPTTSALIEAFEEQIQKRNQPVPTISASILLKPHHIDCRVSMSKSAGVASPVPPRLLSDRYINIFFQEWQPLLPILHRSAFLEVYNQYLSNPEAQSWSDNRHHIAQLFLIFEISAHSSSSKAKPVTSAYQLQWRNAMSAISSTPSIATLQCHILAQLCYLLKADYSHLLRHRAYAASMAYQLYLHQGHKGHSLPILDAELRKKVFWCQYVLDKFTSAATGMPQQIRDSDVSVNYPTDIDDDKNGEEDVQSTTSQGPTKMSSACAMFRLSRILAKTLENLYPTKSSYQLSSAKLHSLSDELDQWQEELPDHLRLRFRNDKPATNLIGCRSPLLSLAYFYTRSLIHRPLLCYGSGSASAAAIIVLAAAAKHEIQIIDLLDEREMNYTFPLAKQDLLLNAGFAILWQSLGLERDSQLIKDNKRSLMVLMSKLNKEQHKAGLEFYEIASSFVPIPQCPPQPTQAIEASTAASTTHSSDDRTPRDKQRSTRKQLQAIASRLSSFNGKSKNEDGVRRASMSQGRVYNIVHLTTQTNSNLSLSSTRSAPVVQAAIATFPPLPILPSDALLENESKCAMLQDAEDVNLDFFPFSDEAIVEPASGNSSSTMLPNQDTTKIVENHRCKNDSWTDYEAVITDSNSPAMLSTIISSSIHGRPSFVTNTSDDWPSHIWTVPTCNLDPETGINSTQSLLSFSEESLASGDEFLFSAAGSRHGSTDDSTVEASASPPVKAMSHDQGDMYGSSNYKVTNNDD